MIVTDITNIGDPQILPFEGTYYCYATSFIDGFYVWESKDLINWSEPRICLAKKDSWGSIDFWAPEVVYHNGKFVMHYSSRLPNRSLRLGVAVADSPLGPFRDVWGKPMFDLGYATIDGSVLRSDEGNFFYYSRDCSEHYVNGVKTSELYCVRLDDTLTRTVGEHRLITTPEHEWERRSLAMPVPHLWNEGPCVMRLGDRYVMNYSANYYASNEYAICLAVADHPQGPFRKPEENPVLSCREGLFGAGHNAFFRGFDGNLYTSFHIQTHPDHPSGNRRAVIGRLTFREENGVLTEEID